MTTSLFDSQLPFALKTQFKAPTGAPLCKDLTQSEPSISSDLTNESFKIHLNVEECSKEMLRQQSYAIKNKLVASKYASLWHKGSYNRTFLCMESTYPYAINNQKGASRKTRWMRRAGSLWHETAGVSKILKLSTNERRALLNLNQ